MVRKTKIKDIRRGMKDLKITATVISKVFDMKSTHIEHATALISDGTAEIPLNLWRGQTVQVNEGDKIKLNDAFAKTRKGKLELSTWEERLQIEPRNQI